MPDSLAPISPEPQTVRECARLQQNCQAKTFAHIDDRHEKVMTGIGEIKEALAFEEGRQAGTQNNKKKKFNWREVVAVIAIVTAAIASAIVAVDKITDRAQPPPSDVHEPTPPR